MEYHAPIWSIFDKISTTRKYLPYNKWKIIQNVYLFNMHGVLTIIKKEKSYNKEKE